MAIKTVQFLRNQDVISGYDAAVAKLQEKWSELSDGSPIVIRYTEEEGEGENVKVASKALFAIKENISGAENAPFVILDGNAQIEKVEAKIEALAEQVAEELGENGSVAEAIAKLKDELQGEIEDVANAAKSYEIVAISGDELTALGANVKVAFKLVDEDGAQAGQIIKLYKDSALKEVALEGQELKFTYILADGSESTVGVDVSQFLAESEFGDGLEVVDHVVKVNLAEDKIVDNKTQKNFIEFEEEGDKKAIALRSIDTDATVLQKEIVVAGLSDQFGAGNYENNDVIAAGTDIYTILQNILCKELYPESNEPL